MARTRLFLVIDVAESVDPWHATELIADLGSQSGAFAYREALSGEAQEDDQDALPSEP